MKKFLPHIIMGIILIISIVGILLMTQQKTASTKKDPKLDKVALPQLTTKIAKNESKLIMKTTYGDITIKLFNKSGNCAFLVDTGEQNVPAISTN